jgi:hypothetical protein
MIEYLSIQGRLTLLFLVSKQNLTPPIRLSDTLKIIKNRIELKNLQPPKVEKGNN